ncbi:MAG: hypothetical protein V3U98_04965 [Acidobacteriota bacterium]
MPGKANHRLSRQERRLLRERQARVRRLRKLAVRIAVVGGLALLAGLWIFDHSGLEEVVEAEVIRTQRWRHSPQGGQTHFHNRATLLIEGLSEHTIDQAPEFQRGQRVPVWIRRGRISGRPYFQELADQSDLGAQAQPLAPRDTDP